MEEFTGYLGKWYLISRIPAWYDNDCDNEIAYYRIIDDRTMEVHNACYTNKELKREAVGKAELLNAETMEFFVSFPESEGRPPEANYIILETDFTSYSLVGSADKEGLWILSRSKMMTSELADKLTRIAIQEGYDTQRMIDTANSII